MRKTASTTHASILYSPVILPSLSSLRARIKLAYRKCVGEYKFDPSKRMIGIMMTRNENDILPETLNSVTKIYDRIFVLDGTEPESSFLVAKSIMDRYDEIKVVLRDQETPGPFPTRDGARHYLLEKVREAYGVNNWIGVIHGDELYTKDPRPVLRRLNPYLTPVVQVRLCHFFLHPDDAKAWDRLESLPVEERVTHYMWPGTPEDRFFFDDGQVDYDPSRHSLVVPYELHYTRLLLDDFVIKQYNYRTPEQALNRAEQRIATGWQRNHYQHIFDNRLVFVKSLHVPGYQPCGYDNVRHTDSKRWSRPRSINDFPLPSF